MRFYRSPHRVSGRQYVQFRQFFVISITGNFSGLNVRLLTVIGGGGGGGGGFPASESLLEPPRSSAGEAGNWGRAVSIPAGVYLSVVSYLLVGDGGSRAQLGTYKVSGTVATYAAYDGSSGSVTSVTLSNGAFYSANGGVGGAGAWQDFVWSASQPSSNYNPNPGVASIGGGGRGRDPSVAQDFGSDGIGGGIECRYGV